MKPNLELHIEELVLHGFPAGDRDRIAVAVQQELSRLLAEVGLPESSARIVEITRLDAGSFTANDQWAARTGADIARSIHRSLSSQEVPNRDR